jgi:hypothetical protein
LETHVVPESLETKMSPEKAAATSLVPSLELATEDQELVGAIVGDHVAPESPER